MLSLSESVPDRLILDAPSQASALVLNAAPANLLEFGMSIGDTLTLPAPVGLSYTVADTSRPMWQVMAGSAIAASLAIGAGVGTYQYAMRQVAVSEIESAGFETASDGLIQAIAAGRISLVPAYARLGIHLNSTPGVIEAAFLSGSSTVVDEVLSGGAVLSLEPNQGQFLHLAVQSDNPALIDALIRLGPLNTNDVLPQIRHVIQGAKWKAFERLAQQDVFLKFVSENGETIAHVAGLSDSIELIQSMQSAGKVDFSAKNAQGQTALHFAVQNDKAVSTTALIAAGVDALQADDAGRSSLMIAWERSHDSVIAAILNGSKPALEQLLSQDLSSVFRSDAISTAKALVSGGLRLDDIQMNGHTPLFDAVQNSKLEMATLLLDSNASPDALSNLRDVQGVTPLMIACATGNHQLVKLLLERGANSSIAASNGATALSIARSNGRGDLVGLLGGV